MICKIELYPRRLDWRVTGEVWTAHGAHGVMYVITPVVDGFTLTITDRDEVAMFSGLQEALEWADNIHASLVEGCLDWVVAEVVP